MMAMMAAAADNKPGGGGGHSFSPVHIYQEVVGYEKPKNDKGRAGNSYWTSGIPQVSNTLG